MKNAGSLHSNSYKTALTFMRATACIVASALLAASAQALYELDPIAPEGKPIPTTQIKTDWPVGNVEMVNNPLRTEGYRLVGSGLESAPWPNDVRMFDMRIRNNGDAQRLIDLLACIKSERLCVTLNPRSESGTIGDKPNDIAAVFQVGCQSEIDSWFSQLKTDESGARIYGSRIEGERRLTEPPKAMPPTLTLFVGNPAIDLSKLHIPATVEVIGNSAGLPTRPTTQQTVEQIEKFIREHDRQRREAGLPDSPDPRQRPTTDAAAGRYAPKRTS